MKIYVSKFLFLTCIMPIIIISIANFYSLNKNIIKLRNYTIEKNVYSINDSLDEINTTIIEDINFLSHDANTKGLKDNKNNESEYLQKLLQSYINTKKGISNVYMASADGKFIKASYKDMEKNFDGEEIDWYKKALKNPDKIVVSDPYEDYTTKKTIITYSKAIFNDKGELQGVIGIDKNLEYLSELINNIESYSGAYSIIFNNEGTIIAHKDSNLIGKNKNDFSWINEVLNIEDNKSEYIKIDNNYYFISKTMNVETGYITCVFIPLNELTKTYLSSLILHFVVLIITLLIVIIFSKNFTNKLTEPIKVVVNLLNKIKDGDFREVSEVKNEYNEEVASMIMAVNELSHDMGLVLSGIKDESNKVTEGCSTLFEIISDTSEVGEEVAKSIQEITQGVTNQAMELEDSVKIVGELEEEINKSINNSDNMSRTSSEVKVSSEEGRIALEKLTEKYLENKEANDSIVMKVNMLSDRSNKIGIIVEAIKAITEQTNLLALNAGIEAARAGEVGRGFAVVADEVRKLAEESAKSATEINEVIVNIKQDINNLNKDILKSNQLNNETGESLVIARNKFETIISRIDKLQDSIKSVTYSLEKISSNKDSVVLKISEVAAVGEETAAITEEVSAASEEQSSALQEVANEAEGLRDNSKQLNELIKKFKI